MENWAYNHKVMIHHEIFSADKKHDDRDDGTCSVEFWSGTG